MLRVSLTLVYLNRDLQKEKLPDFGLQENNTQNKCGDTRRFYQKSAIQKADFY